MIKNREDGYADMQSNMPICETFTSVMKEMGHDVFLGGGKSTIEGGASTDMGTSFFFCFSPIHVFVGYLANT